MKIFTPINTINEVKDLIEAGSEELYCGIVPKQWTDKYSRMFTVNRRHHKANQLDSYEELSEIINYSHKKGVKVYVTMNNLFYIEDQKDMIYTFLKEIESCNADGVIISSVPVMRICKQNTKLSISVSGEALPINNESIAFFKKIGVERITFPRDISLREMKEIMEEHPDLEYEPFILRERCGFCGGNCFASHGIINKNFCAENWNMEIFNTEDDMMPYEEFLKFKQTTMGYEMWRKKDYIPVIKNKIPDTRLSECGLCALKSMKDMGVSSLKIVGRGIPTDNKVAHIKLLKKAIEICDKEKDYTTFLEKVKDLKNTQGYCDSKMNCYYRDF